MEGGEKPAREGGRKRGSVQIFLPLPKEMRMSKKRGRRIGIRSFLPPSTKRKEGETKPIGLSFIGSAYQTREGGGQGG